jgi:tartrate-resistant acid phosphatase type 5
LNGEQWAGGPRRDWVATGNETGLADLQRAYDNRFRTLPDPMLPAAELTFGVLGDFGVGILKNSANEKQHEVAQALERAVDAYGIKLLITTGDNIYSKKHFGAFTIGSGKEDDDWFFTYYQPYRYIINRIPVYPCIGNHDADETEEGDDRGQLYDNFYINERFAGEEASGRASLNPGTFYRFRYGSDIEFICIDSSKEDLLSRRRLFDHPRHQQFLDLAFQREWVSPPAGEFRSYTIRRIVRGRGMGTPGMWIGCWRDSRLRMCGRYSAGMNITFSIRLPVAFITSCPVRERR